MRKALAFGVGMLAAASPLLALAEDVRDARDTRPDRPSVERSRGERPERPEWS